ncbi:MAG: DUF2339 domain-containing protein [Polyangiales bacterium]
MFLVVAGLVAASANRQRRNETAALRVDLDQLHVRHMALLQKLTALEAREGPVATEVPTEVGRIPTAQRVDTSPLGTPASTSAVVGVSRVPSNDAGATPETAASTAVGSEPLAASLTVPPDLVASTANVPSEEPQPSASMDARGEGDLTSPGAVVRVDQPPTVETGEVAQSAPEAGSTAVGPAHGPSGAGGRAPSPPGANAPPPRKGPGLEEWLGVRGIALVGALTLVIAGVYFFRYSVEHGLITPAMRVIVGLILGVACIGASEKPLRARHELLANFIAGAGVALLYLASWASAALYDLVPRPLAFGLMGVTTAVCCALALRHKAQSIALIGLLGGFVTPISLSTGQDRPLALFGYLLLLDVALLAVAQRTRWGLLALLSVLGTFVYQLGWIMGRMGAERVWWGVVIIALFTSVFALGTVLAGRRAAAGAPADGAPRPLETLMAQATQALALLLPFLFPLFFATHRDLRMDLWPTLVLVSALTVGAGVVALATRAFWIQVAAAAAGGVTLLMHVVASHEAALGGAFCALIAALTLVHAGVVLRFVRTEGRAQAAPSSDTPSPLGLSFQPSHAAVLFAVAASFALLMGAERVLPLAGTLTALLIVITSLGVAAASPLRWLAALVAPLATVSVAALHVTQGALPGRPSEWVWLVLTIAPVLGANVGVLVRDVEKRSPLDHAAGIAALVFAVHLTVLPPGVPVTVGLFAVAAAVALVAVWLPLARSGAGASFGWVVLALSIRAAWLDGHESIASAEGSWLAVLVLVAAGATSVPMLALGARARASRGLYRGSALAMPLFFLPILEAYRDVFGRHTDGIPAVLSSAVVLTMLAVSRVRAPATVRVSAMAWPAATALGFASVAIPLQLENEWVTVGWALLGAGLLALFRRIDHAGLKYFALLHFAAVGVRLLLNPYVLEYHPVSAWPFVNWLAYTYLVPAAAACLGFMWLRDIEIARRRPFEASLMPKQVTLLANALGVLAVAIGFAWVNLTIIDAFAPEGPLELDFDRRPARDLTLSLAWAVYGAGLLGLGMWRKSTSLRGLSLCLVMLTIGKVFLVDLGNLQDLYRVASLVGLAFSLIIISLAYRRFVFPPAATSEQEGGPT